MCIRDSYNTPEKFLTELLDCVKNQTYQNWELCLADGSDHEHAYVGEICRKYAAEDPRILYRVLDHNEGISGNKMCIRDRQRGYREDI